MQSFLEQRRIRKQLEKQIVVKHNLPHDVWTSERRYWYPEEGGIQSEDRYIDDGEPARRRREHGHQSLISGPVLEPRHTARSHLERDGDVERADYDPAFDVDPFTINTRDTLGGDVDMMVTGLERDRPRNYDRPDSETEVYESGLEKKRNMIVVVTFEGDCDPMDPHNWSFKSRVWYTFILSSLGFFALWASTIDTTVLTSTMKLFRTSFELETVPTALYLIFLGLGGLIFAPISEVLGRNPIYLFCLPICLFFDMGAGLSQSVGQRIALRGLTGLFASGPLVISAAALVDIWTAIERLYAFPFYATAAFLGATVAPAPGAIITYVHAVSWRFVDWASCILGGVILASIFFFLPETYSPILLHWKAKHLRRLTKDDRYRAPLEFKRVSLARRFVHALYRPTLLFWTEPIIMIFACYMAIIFIILYTFSAGFVDIYLKVYKLNEGQVGTTFLSLAIGVSLALPFIPLTIRLTNREIHHARQRGQKAPEPEINLYFAMLGAPWIPIGLFWMGWTARPEISLWCPLAASLVFGFGVCSVFISSYAYVAATFDYHPASALSSIQCFRFVASGVMAVVARLMYEHLGVGWTATVLGLISVAFMPVPYLLYRYGAVVRSWSRYARKEVAVVEEQTV